MFYLFVLFTAIASLGNGRSRCQRRAYILLSNHVTLSHRDHNVWGSSLWMAGLLGLYHLLLNSKLFEGKNYVLPSWVSPIVLISWLALSNCLIQLNMNWKGYTYTQSLLSTYHGCHIVLPFSSIVSPSPSLCCVTHLLSQESLQYLKPKGRHHICPAHCSISGPSSAWHIRPPVNAVWGHTSMRTNLITTRAGFMENTLINTKVWAGFICVMQIHVCHLPEDRAGMVILTGKWRWVGAETGLFASTYVCVYLYMHNYGKCSQNHNPYKEIFSGDCAHASWWHYFWL